jgi:hypothetical protein
MVMVWVVLLVMFWKVDKKSIEEMAWMVIVKDEVSRVVVVAEVVRIVEVTEVIRVAGVTEVV